MRGQPEAIDVQGCATLVELFERSIARFPQRPAYSSMGRTLSYAELERLSRYFGAWLQQAAGLVKGERLAIMLPNVLQYPVALFGALRAGLTVVNTNPLYTRRELLHQLEDSGAGAIVVLENFAHVLADVLPGTRVRSVVVTGVGDLLHFPRSVLVNLALRHLRGAVPRYRIEDAVRFRHTLSEGSRRELSGVALDAEDLAFLQYTGGTTGRARGAMLTHRNIVANVAQAATALGGMLEEGHEVLITALPLYHIFSLTANCLTMMRLGACNHLITNPRDLRGFVRELRRVRFTCITGVNTLYNGLLHTPGFADLDFSSLKFCLAGGMPLQRSVAQRWHAVTGLPLLEAYGLTETSPAACLNPPGSGVYTGGIGRPFPATECSIQDEGGAILPPGEAGELCVRGPQVMKGYWNRPEDTAATLSPDGWLRTGDIAVMDETGFVRVVDRKKDMIIVSGFNVYPKEVEEVITSHPGVHEAGVIGVPDEQTGESVKAVIVARDPALSAEQVRSHCRGQLAAYKVPRRIEFTGELPKSTVGKILRRELRERFGGAGRPPREG